MLVRLLVAAISPSPSNKPSPQIFLQNRPKGGLIQDLIYVESVTWQLPTRLSGVAVAVKPASIFSNLPRHSSPVSPSELSWALEI